MNRLYLISYYFAPLGRADGVNRSYMVKYLSEHKLNLDVICCENPHGFIRNFQKDISLLKVIPPEVKIHRVKSRFWGPLGSLAEISGITDDPFSNWIHPVIDRADDLFDSYGILYAIVPPVTNAKIAAKISKKKDMPFVIDFRDDVFTMDKSIVQKASALIASTEKSLENMMNHYQYDSKGHVFYNGYAKEKDFRIEKQQSEILTIIYAGLLNLDQNPVKLISAVKQMYDEHPETRYLVEIDYFGPKNFYTSIFLRKHLSKRIRFNGYVAFQSVLQKIASADLAYSSVRGSGNSYRIPSKVFQYIAMETPILAVGPDGALKTLVTKYKLGRFSDYNDTESQARDIHCFLRDTEYREEVVESIKKVKKVFSLENQVHGLVEFLNSL